MKLIVILAALMLTASVAHADPVIVDAPKAPVSADAAKQYVAKLENAVKTVCYDAVAPVIGLGHYAYLDCIKATRARVAKEDPTGLYAAQFGADAVVLAAK